jgi:hypothetical protein
MWPAIASLGASAISGLSSAASLQQQGSFNSSEASKQRMWEEQMSNTAHRREVLDMQAAGLNPYLSAMGGSGASSPSGSSASVSAPDYSGISDSLKQFAMMMARNEVNIGNATAKNIDADTRAKQAQTMNYDMDTVRLGAVAKGDSVSSAFAHQRWMYYLSEMTPSEREIFMRSQMYPGGPVGLVHNLAGGVGNLLDSVASSAKSVLQRFLPSSPVPPYGGLSPLRR